MVGPDDADKVELDALFCDLRQKLSNYLRNHGGFYPGLFDGAPVEVRRELVANCAALPSRLDIIERLPKGGRFAEVGTLAGDFIVRVIDINQPDEVHLFDLGFQNIRPENRRRLDEYGRVTYHLGDTSVCLSRLDEDFFDAVYIDGDHSYEGVWRDLTEGLRVLKRCGYLICNDYTNWDPIQCLPYGVHSAVNRFMNANDLAFEYLGLSSWGFHDVALRRVTQASRTGHIR